MSVLIKGMDMPKDGRTITITIFSSGEVSIGTSTYTKPICKNFIDMMLNYHAVEIPTPHGRLIDVDEKLVPVLAAWIVSEDDFQTVLDAVERIPSVIESEE